MKAIPFQQTKPYGCGMYVLANIFKNSSFVHAIVPDVGMDIFDCNEALQLFEKEQGLYVAPIFLVATNAKDQPRLLDTIYFDCNYDMQSEYIRDNRIMIRLCSVFMGKKSHYIAVIQNFKCRCYHVIDSLKKTIETFFDASELLQAYHFIGVDIFSLRHIRERDEMNNKNAIITFDRNYYSHLIPDEYL